MSPQPVVKQPEIDQKAHESKRLDQEGNYENLEHPNRCCGLALQLQQHSSLNIINIVFLQVILDQNEGLA